MHSIVIPPIIIKLIQIMNSALLLLTTILSMGFFNFLKKDRTTSVNPSDSILGMILLDQPGSLNINKVTDELTTRWNLKIDEKSVSNETSVLFIEGYKIAITSLPLPIPSEEVTAAAEFNYYWPNGVEEASKHKGHIMLSILNAGKNTVQENLLFSKIASSIMNNSQSMGIYLGSRSLVLKKDFYENALLTMSDQHLPLHIWIYFGFRTENGKQSGYTYGLTEFGKKEMEIIDSSRSLEELNEIMYNMIHYVLAYNVNLRSGETIGISAEQKLMITESRGHFIEGNTLKIGY